MQRDPEAILAAHRMDPSRKELYVEGPRDRSVLLWLVGEALDRNARVLEVSGVSLPLGEGGERGRLLAFARMVQEEEVSIAFFADADFDRLLSRSVPKNVWLTDPRDLEGYVLRANSFGRVMVACPVDDLWRADTVLEEVLRIARTAGVLRLMSELDGMKLAFGKTRIKKYVSVGRGKTTFNVRGYLTAVIQNSGVSLKNLDPCLERLEELSGECSSIPDSELVHGKDAFEIFNTILLKVFRRADMCDALWATFERSWRFEHRSLGAACDFLATT